MTSSNSKRTAKRERDAWQFRYDLCAEVSRCEYCGKRKPVNLLACHELLYGALRLACIDQRCAILVVDNDCHRKVALESKSRQLARIYLNRPDDLDIPRFCELWCRGPQAVTLDEVMAQVDLILSGN